MVPYGPSGGEEGEAESPWASAHPGREHSEEARRDHIWPVASALLVFPLRCPQEPVERDSGERRFCLLKTFCLEVSEARGACLWLSAAPGTRDQKRKLGQKLYVETLDSCLESIACAQNPWGHRMRLNRSHQPG